MSIHRSSVILSDEHVRQLVSEIINSDPTDMGTQLCEMIIPVGLNLELYRRQNTRQLTEPLSHYLSLYISNTSQHMDIRTLYAVMRPFVIHGVRPSNVQTYITALNDWIDSDIGINIVTASHALSLFSAAIRPHPQLLTAILPRKVAFDIDDNVYTSMMQLGVSDGQLVSDMNHAVDLLRYLAKSPLSKYSAFRQLSCQVPNYVAHLQQNLHSWACAIGADTQPDGVIAMFRNYPATKSLLAYYC